MIALLWTYPALLVIKNSQLSGNLSREEIILLKQTIFTVKNLKQAGLNERQYVSKLFKVAERLQRVII